MRNNHLISFGVLLRESLGCFIAWHSHFLPRQTSARPHWRTNKPFIFNELAKFLLQSVLTQRSITIEHVSSPPTPPVSTQTCFRFWTETRMSKCSELYTGDGESEVGSSSGE